MTIASKAPATDTPTTAKWRATESSRRWATLALCLIAPAPSVGVLVGLTFEEGALGTFLWAVAKVWLFGLPVVWRWLVDKKPLSWSPPRRGGLSVGAGVGGAVGVLILALYFGVARHAIDPTIVQGKVEPLGLTHPTTFLALAAYIVFVNSALEEYVYRWFVFRQLEILVGGRLAVVGAALIFVAHHTIILAAYFPAWVVVLGSTGVFVGGVIWSILYLKYRSIWPAYLSHAMVDVAVLIIGYWIIIGPG